MSIAAESGKQQKFTQAEAKAYLRLAGCAVDLPAPDTRVLGLNGWSRSLLVARVKAAARTRSTTTKKGR